MTHALPASDLPALYTLAVQLHPTPVRARLLDELVRQSRWAEYVRQHTEFIDGVEAGRRLWLERNTVPAQLSEGAAHSGDGPSKSPR
jgi:hypothetical protein